MTSPDPLKNHPGWAKGVRVRLNTGQEVLILEDGDYRSDGRTFGLWHYWVRYPDGRKSIRVPEVGDTPLPAEVRL